MIQMKTPFHLLSTHRVPGTIQNIKTYFCSFRAKMMVLLHSFMHNTDTPTPLSQNDYIFQDLLKTSVSNPEQKQIMQLKQKSTDEVCQMLYLMSSPSETTTPSSSSEATTSSSTSKSTTSTAASAATSSPSSSSASPATTSRRSFLTRRSR